MSEDLYSVVSGVYDLFNEEIDYGDWADYIQTIFKKYEKNPTSLVLDLGCGTGKMTLELNRRGYDMTGVDINPEMLSEAADIARREGADNILWLLQDMCSFELYGTVDGAVCCLDGINHLTGSGELEKCLNTVHNYLIPDGIFIFDINTPYKFENIYGNRDYILECNKALAAWQNDYDPKRKICHFYISLFSDNGDGTYKREDSVGRERCFSETYIKRALKKCGFELLFISGDHDFEKPAPSAPRWYIAARCKK